MHRVSESANCVELCFLAYTAGQLRVKEKERKREREREREGGGEVYTNTQKYAYTS